MANFKDIIGQESIKKHLQTAIKTGNLSHAYIINGEYGSGRQTIASALAKTIQCQSKTDDTDAKALFGVESVKDWQEIDLVIKLEEFNKEQEYDRLGLEEQYIEFLDSKVVCHSIPIRPGRNVAIICESAAVNHRQKKMGYNAAVELYNRVTNNLAEKRKNNK